MASFTSSAGVHGDDRVPHWRRRNAKDLLELDQKKFGDSTKIDNKWWPLVPGTRHVYDGFERGGWRAGSSQCRGNRDRFDEGCRRRPRSCELGEDYSDGKLEERELAFHAQDKEGNIWHLGQIERNIR